MATVTEQPEIRSQSRQVGGLRAHLAGLSGAPYLRFRESYGDELKLHLGKSVPYKNPRMNHVQQGSIVLGTRTSAWALTVGASGRTYYSDNFEVWPKTRLGHHVEMSAFESAESIAPGSTLVGVAPWPWSSGISLGLTFSDDSNFVIYPALREEEDDDPTLLPCWQLFLPDDRLIEGWPDGSWTEKNSSIKPSDAAREG